MNRRRSDFRSLNVGKIGSLHKPAGSCTPYSGASRMLPLRLARELSTTFFIEGEPGMKGTVLAKLFPSKAIVLSFVYTQAGPSASTLVLYYYYYIVSCHFCFRGFPSSCNWAKLPPQSTWPVRRVIFVLFQMTLEVAQTTGTGRLPSEAKSYDCCSNCGIPVDRYDKIRPNSEFETISATMRSVSSASVVGNASASYH